MKKRKDLPKPLELTEEEMLLVAGGVTKQAAGRCETYVCASCGATPFGADYGPDGTCLRIQVRHAPECLALRGFETSHCGNCAYHHDGYCAR